MRAFGYLEALLALPMMTDVIVSPDGKWVAWSWFQAGPVMDVTDVYVMPTDASAAPFRLTDSRNNAVAIAWAPDSRAVLIRIDPKNNWHVQLLRVDLDRPQVLVPLTEPEASYVIAGGVLHPNGRWLIYSANVDFETGALIEPFWVYRHDLQTGERHLLARPSKPCVSDPQLNQSGDWLIYSRKDLSAAGRQVWLVDMRSGSDEEILNFGADTRVTASWFPHRDQVLFTAEVGRCRSVGLWDLKSRQLRWVLHEKTQTVERSFVPPPGSQIILAELDGKGLRYSTVDPYTCRRTWMADLPSNLTLLTPVTPDEWIGVYGNSSQPRDIVRFSVSAPCLEKSTSLSCVWQHTPLTSEDFVRAQDFQWQSVDGLSIQGWLYQPRETARGTIVHVHGGPASHCADEIDIQIQYLVRHGFNVLAPNFRGSTGFGSWFLRALEASGGWGGLELLDIRTGIEALMRAGIARAGQVGITGQSYGGYCAWCAITRFPYDLVAAAAPVSAMVDLALDYSTAWPATRRYYELMMGGRPDQIPERYRSRSPINFVRNIRGRLLIVHGQCDQNVSVKNVQAAEIALKQAGIPYEKLIFENEAHGVARRHNLHLLYGALLDFFTRAFSKPMPDPEPDRESLAGPW